MVDFSIERAAVGRVAGVDEAGRGPLAGPVVAAAVVFPAGLHAAARGRRASRRGLPASQAAALPAALLDLIGLIDDSKRLTPDQRQVAYLALRAAPGVEIGVGAASVIEVGRLNILRAALLAMRRAVSRLPAPPDLALVDGNQPPPLDCPVRCVIGGDALSLSIAAASIVAKVVRDRAMTRLAIRCPGYGWEHNAGYATEAHRAALHRLGPTRHHRSDFGTVRQLRLDFTHQVDLA